MITQQIDSFFCVDAGTCSSYVWVPNLNKTVVDIRHCSLFCPWWVTLSICCSLFALPVSVHYLKMWHLLPNWKSVTYCSDIRGGHLTLIGPAIISMLVTLEWQKTMLEAKDFNFIVKM